MEAGTPTRKSVPRRSMVANTATNGVALFASLLSTLVFFPLLVKAFGAAEYGVYVIATSVTGVAFMFDLGIGASTVRLVAQHTSLDDADAGSRVVVSSLALLTLLGFVAAVIIAGIGLAAGALFAVTPTEAALLRQLLMIGALMQLWYWPSSLAVSILTGVERYDLVAKTSLMSTAASVIAIGIVLVLDAGPLLLMVMGGLTMVLTSLINAAWAWSLRPAQRLSALPSVPVAHEIVTGGLPVFIASMANLFNREQADRLILAVFLGPAAVAVYEVAAKLSMLVAQVTVVATSAVLPVASGMSAKGDEGALRDLFVRGSRYVVLAVAPVIVTVLVLTNSFVGVWFGPAFSASVPIAWMLITAQLFVPLYQIGDPILIGMGRFSQWVPRGVVLAVSNVALSVVFVQFLGVAGVALGTMFSGLLELPLYAHVVLRELDVRARVWLRSAAPGYFALPVAAVVAAAMALTPLARSLPGIAVCGAVAVATYWCVAWFFVLSAQERTALAARLGRFGSSVGTGER